MWPCYNHVSWFAEECLLSYKNWCIVLVTFLSVPLCLFCWAVNLDLAWTYYFTGILIASSVVPIAFSIIWARATAKGNMKAQIFNNFLSNLILMVTLWDMICNPFIYISGMISGVIGGCVCGMVVWLYLSSREEGGLAAEYFVKNTGKVFISPCQFRKWYY